MAILLRDALKLYFQTGDMPTQSNFYDLLDSVRLKSEIITINEVSSAYGTIALVDGDTINWDASTGNVATLILATGDGAKTLNITNMVANRFYVLNITRDGVGGVVTLTLPAGHLVFNGGGGVVEPSTMASAKDTLIGFYTGTETRWSIGKNAS